MSDTIITIVLLLVLYFLPTFIASVRECKSDKGISKLNFFFGWTGIGWLLALLWAMFGEVKKKKTYNKKPYSRKHNDNDDEIIINPETDVKENQPVELDCKIKETIFTGDDGFKILLVQDIKDQYMTGVYLLGNFPKANLREGTILHIEGEWKRHPKYGMQIRVLKGVVRPGSDNEVRWGDNLIDGRYEIIDPNITIRGKVVEIFKLYDDTPLPLISIRIQDNTSKTIYKAHGDITHGLIKQDDVIEITGELRFYPGYSGRDLKFNSYKFISQR